MQKRNKIWSFFIIITILLAGVVKVQTTEATDNKYVAVINQNIRSSANDQASPVIYLEAGEKIELVNTIDDDWFKVSFDGKQGYVHRGDITSEKNFKNPDREYTQVNNYQEVTAKKEYIVAIDVNLRTRNTNKASSLKLMKQGDKVSYIGTTDNNWFLVEHGGTKGYVHRGDVTTEEALESNRELHKVPLKDKEKFDELRVIIDRNLRTKDERQYGAVATVRRNEKVTYKGTTDNNWFLVNYKGKEGYIYRGDVTSDSKKPVTPDTGETNPTDKEIDVSQPNGLEYITTANSLNLRAGDSAKHEILTKIPKGQTVKHLGTVKNNKSWYKVDYSGTIGFVHSNYLEEKLEVAPEPEDNIPVTKPNGLEYVTTAMSLNLRAGDSANHEILARIPNGQTVKHLGTAKNNQSWFKVDYNGIIGFVHSNYLKQKVELSGARVFLDYGHGGADGGAPGIGGRLEKEDVIRVGLLIADKLRNQGIIVDESRTTDQTLTLKQRTDMANAKKIDYFVSIHRNSHHTSAANGVEVFSHENSSQKAKSLSNTIQRNLVNLGFRNRGSKHANFYVLRNTKAPAVLVEVGFITNDYDNHIFDTKLNDIAQAVADGVVTELGKK